MTLSNCLPFPSFILSIFIFMNLLKLDGPSALKSRLFQEMLLMRLDRLQSLKQFFINVPYHILVASPTLMALF